MATIKLPRLKSSLPIVDREGRVNNLFLRALNEVIAAAESQIGALQAAVDAQAAAAAAAASATAASVAAGNAQTAADDVATAAALANSFATGLTITATDAGSNATISISAHTREYGDGTSVSVNAGNVTALAYNTDYWVGYIQASRAGGAVTYTAATSARGNGSVDPNYHFVGAVRTPISGGGAANGNPVVPPGFREP